MLLTAYLSSPRCISESSSWCFKHKIHQIFKCSFLAGLSSESQLQRYQLSLQPLGKYTQVHEMLVLQLMCFQYYMWYRLRGLGMRLRGLGMRLEGMGMKLEGLGMRLYTK